MYLEDTNTFVNIRDIKNIMVNQDHNVLITYLGEYGTLCIKCKDLQSAQNLLMKLSKRAEEVQANTYGYPSAI